MAGTDRSDDTRLTLAQFTAGAESLSPERAMQLVRASALALDRFHARRAVHGALYPRLLTLRGDDEITVAPATEGAAADTARYWSPQRRAGQPPRPSDDLYALGVIIAQLLGATDAAAGDPVTPPDPRLASLEELVRVLTSWSPAERPATGAEVVRALDCAIAVRHAPLQAAGDETPPAPWAPVEPRWATAERVSQARRALELAQATPPRPVRPARPPRVRAPLTKGHYPDMPLPLGWVAAIVVVLCSVYLLPLYFMVFPSG
jgi:hypothetical protein